jgi:hypothetical protein
MNLRSHVAQSTSLVNCLEEDSMLVSGEAQITHLDSRITVGEEEIFRLDVPVHYRRYLRMKIENAAQGA